jgi:hypothetical protein
MVFGMTYPLSCPSIAVRKNGVASLAYAPGIQEAVLQYQFSRLSLAAAHHGLPGQARQ